MISGRITIRVTWRDNAKARCTTDLIDVVYRVLEH